ncbi:MAG: cadherin-like beta sandwich domain-containing protein [Agarilytica sp.]
MMQSAIRRLLVVSLISLVFACGGEDITDFTEVVDVRLGSLEVVSGGTLMLGDNVVEEFDPDVFGAYSIDLDDAGATEVSLRVALDDENTGDVVIDVVQVAKGEDDADLVERISSGDTFPVGVSEGANLVFIRVSSRSNAARAEYSLQINRISSSAALQDILIDNVRGSLEDFIFLGDSERFSPDILNYEVLIVDGDRCGVEIQPEPESRFAEVRVNGELTEWRESVFIPLPEDVSGESVVVPVLVEVTPEDGGTATTYTFNIRKNGESESDIQSDAFLRSLVISPGRQTLPFKCSSQAMIQRVDASGVGSLSLTAEIYDSRVGAELTLGVDDPDQVGIQIDPDTAVTLVSGEAYSGELFDELDVGSHGFLLRVDSVDGTTSFVYQVALTVSETNEIYVTSAEALQTALLSAEPNDEIVIASGIYEGIVGAESGHASAHFFGDADGDEDQKIIVRAESEGVILRGSNTAEHAVLRLSGSYWEVDGLAFTNAQTGIVLDDAENVILKSVSVNNVGERGIVFQNGTSDSQIESGFIDRTGTQEDAVSGEAVVIGEGVGTSTNNGVRRVVFGRNIANEHISLTALADDTAIQFNIFESDNTLLQPFVNRSLISVAGGSVEISYNHFEFDEIATGTHDIAQLINVNTAIGSTADIFQNIFDLDDSAVVSVANNGQGSVLLADNRRIDAGAVDTSGVTSAADSAVFQIQSVLDSNLCLAKRDVNHTESDPLESLVIMEACADDIAQQWILSHVEEGYVQLVQNTVDLNEKMVPKAFSGFGFSFLTVCELVEESETGSCKDSSSALQWSIDTDGGYVSFVSRADPNRNILEAAEDLEDDDELAFPPMRIEPFSDSFENKFRLIRQ